MVPNGTCIYKEIEVAEMVHMWAHIKGIFKLKNL